MVRPVAERLLQAFIALLALSAIVFATSRATGDPLALLLPIDATREQHERAARALGLDQPLPVQYGLFLRDAAMGDLGRSLRSGEAVIPLLQKRLGASLQLGSVALLLTFAVGIPLGVISATRRGTRLDGTIKVVGLLGQSMPSFWVGILLIQVFAVGLRWVPAGTNQGLVALVMPAVTMALFGIAGISRLVRSSMLEILGSDFILLARAKGLPERLVVWRHALRNSLLPVASFGGLFFVTLMTFAIVVEVVFAWPGIGSLAYTAILNRDFPVIQGVALLTGAIAIVVSLATDVIYMLLDPRIRHGSH
jgi:peptide/nickel transport system permease protein